MDILSKIVDRKRLEIAAAKERCQSENWPKRASQAPPAADFEMALRSPGRIRVIAEMKRRSPSAGILREDFQPEEIARSYHTHGADAISVLTDVDFFGGSIDDLTRVHQTVPTPILRKDFVLDPVQVYEAKIAGASAVLLIAECLEPPVLKDLVVLIQSLAMTPLVELHDPANLPAVLDSGTSLVGINNRNLHTFQTDLAHTLELLADIPRDRLVVSESGIRTREDVDRLESAGVGAILVGEAFMRAPAPGEKLAELIRRSN